MSYNQFYTSKQYNRYLYINVIIRFVIKNDLVLNKKPLKYTGSNKILKYQYQKVMI